MNGLSLRRLMRCSARANCSLPTPVSPSSSTVIWLCAAARTSSQAARKPGDWPIISAPKPSARSSIVERSCPTCVCSSNSWSAIDSGVKKRMCRAASSHSSIGLPTMRQLACPMPTHSTSL